MRVFLLDANVNNFEVLVSAGGNVVEWYRRFDGHRLPPTVECPEFEALEQGLQTSDFPGLTSHIPVFSPRAWAVLEDLLLAAGECVPLRCEMESGTYRALNVTCLVDALDVERSQVKRFRSGRIMRVLRYAFVAEKLTGLPLFKIPQRPLQDVYASDAFVERVVASGLDGFVFKLLWADHGPVILCPYCMGVIDEETVICPTCGLDVTRDAAFEVSLAEMACGKRHPCPSCGTRIQALADPCPFCGRGERRQGRSDGVVIVV